MYVEDVEDIKTSHNRCLLKYVEDVKDRSNTHKGCNAMDVEDVKDIKTSHNLSTSSTYIALQPLCVFDLSSTPSTLL